MEYAPPDWAECQIRAPGVTGTYWGDASGAPPPAVIGVPHAEKGEEPVAIVECHATAASTEEELLAHCRARLAPYKVPRRFHLVAPGPLPRGLTEKILKRVLRKQYGGSETRR